MEQEITLKVAGKKLKTSRQALQDASPYFQAMFASGMKESVADEIVIHDIDPQFMQMLIDAAQGKEIDVNDENVYDLLRSGSMFQFDDVVGLCTSYLMETVTPQSAIDAWVAGDMFGIESLCKVAVSTILWDFEEFSRSETLVANCPTQLLVTVLGSDKINVDSENEICDVVKLWVHHNANACAPEDIKKVLSTVRYFNADRGAVRSLADCSLKFAPEFMEIVVKCCEGSVKVPQEIMNVQLLPKRTRCFFPAVIASGVACESCSYSPLIVLVFSKEKNGFCFHSKLPTLPKALHGYVICTVGQSSKCSYMQHST